MIALRHKTQALVYGDYGDLDPENPAMFAYPRSLGTDRYLIVLNFSGNSIRYNLPNRLKPTSLLITNEGSSEASTSTLNLRRWEARIYEH